MAMVASIAARARAASLLFPTALLLMRRLALCQAHCQALPGAVEWRNWSRTSIHRDSASRIPGKTLISLLHTPATTGQPLFAGGDLPGVAMARIISGIGDLGNRFNLAGRENVGTKSDAPPPAFVPTG
jgi:hypothetical protein